MNEKVFWNVIYTCVKEAISVHRYLVSIFVLYFFSDSGPWLLSCDKVERFIQNWYFIQKGRNHDKISNILEAVVRGFIYFQLSYSRLKILKKLKYLFSVWSIMCKFQNLKIYIYIYIKNWTIFFLYIRNQLLGYL